MNHTNVVQMVGVCTAGEPVLLVLEFCEHGSLDKFLKTRGRTGMNQLSEDAMRCIALDVSRGCEYIHDLGYVHRDVAARNVLISATHVCKLADFGFARDMGTAHDTYYRAANRGKIPVRWCSPEVLLEARYSHASDVWAYGITLHEVYTLGALPYGEWNNDRVLIAVQRGFSLESPPGCPPAISAMIKRCLAFEPHERPTMGELASFFANPAVCTIPDSADDSAPVYLALIEDEPDAVYEIPVKIQEPEKPRTLDLDVESELGSTVRLLGCVFLIF